MDDEADDQPRWPRDLRGPAPMGQRGIDDAVLPGGRAGGQARARPRRAARAAAAGDPGRGGDRRRARPGGDLHAVQRGPARRTRLGSGDVDRHGVRARRGGAADAPDCDAAARIPADACGRRRPAGTAGDRNRVHRACIGGGADHRDRAVRRADRTALRAGRAPGRFDRRRHGTVGGDVQVRHRPGDLRPGDRPGHQRVPAVARRPRAGDGRDADRSASSRRPSWRAAPSRACCRRSPPTSASSTSCTHGPAT